MCENPPHLRYGCTAVTAASLADDFLQCLCQAESGDNGTQPGCGPSSGVVGFEALSAWIKRTDSGVADIVLLISVWLRLQHQFHEGLGIDIPPGNGCAFLDPFLRIGGQSALRGILHESLVSQQFAARTFRRSESRSAGFTEQIVPLGVEILSGSVLEQHAVPSAVSFGKLIHGKQSRCVAGLVQVASEMKKPSQEHSLLLPRLCRIGDELMGLVHGLRGGEALLDELRQSRFPGPKEPRRRQL